MSQIMDVIVVGCGASGIAALSKLHEAGLRVVGLEAADRVGGRVCSVPFGEGVVDVGAAWCHGEDGNIVYQLAQPHGLLQHPLPGTSWYLLSNGEKLADVVASNMLHSMEAIIADANKNNSRSVSDCLRTGLDTFSSLQENITLTNMFLEWYERNNHVGGQSSPDTGKSLKGLEECWTSPGDALMNWKGRGYKTILDILLKRIPDPSQELNVEILTNKEVETIKWKARLSELDQDNALVQVTCKDGSLYAAKRVIVTVSIGVLKERHLELFNPQLPTEKINSINTLQLCVLDKIYIEFEEAWWPKEPINFALLWRDEDKKKFSVEDKWITEIYGLMTVEHQPKLLLAWIYGEGARLMEKISTSDVRVGVEKLLNTVFANQFAVTPIRSILRSQWASNPLVRGTYSYRSVATEENGGSAEILSKPLYHGDGIPVVCFGGEATSHHRHSTVHGAVEAGFREAKRIIASF